jgi:hypothetical protein
MSLILYLDLDVFVRQCAHAHSALPDMRFIETVDEYTIADWPVRSAEAQAAIDEMKNTHRVVPIPAYDIAGKLIPPTDYRAQLMGAVVELYFTLTHWSIGPKDKVPRSDTYVADIVSMRVVSPPKTPMVSPRKRKTFACDPMSSPSKKVRK